MLDVIKNMYEEGFPIRRISQKTGVKEPDIKKYIQENNIELKKETFDLSKIGNILELYFSGISAKQLGMKYSIDKRRIQKWANDKNILRSKDDSHRIHIFDQNIFDVIDDPAKAYWLGFLYADVYNNQEEGFVTLSLQRSDLEHLKKYSKFVGISDNDLSAIWADSEIGKNKKCWIKLNSQYFSEALAKKGCMQAKSLIIKFPTEEQVPKHLQIHFIRGMFDGDGSLCLKKKYKEYTWSIASTKEGCDSIREIFKVKYNIDLNIYYISETEKNTYTVTTNGNEKIHKLCTVLYEESTGDIRLDRKYETFLELGEKQKNRIVNRPNYFLSEVEEEKVISVIDKCKSLAEISRSTGLSYGSIRKILKKCNISEDSIGNSC